MLKVIISQEASQLNVWYILFADNGRHSNKVNISFILILFVIY